VSKVFIDTNIFIYAIDEFNPEKKERSRQVVKNAVENLTAVISTQVLQELYVAGTTKLGVDPWIMKSVVTSLDKIETVVVDTDLIKEAVDTSILNRISFWDALVVAAAESAQCEILYTEDLNNGHVIRGVKIINPFLDTASV
jgi:predicted nucleic acid-binding protein